MSNGFDVVVLGAAQTDVMMHPERFPGPGEIALSDRLQIASGGRGANQAVAAARLGARVSFIGRVGHDDRGRAVLADLMRERVDVRHVGFEEQAETGAAVVLVDDRAEREGVVYPGANALLTVQHVEAAAQNLASTKVLLVSLGVPSDCVLAAARIAFRKGARVILEPGRTLDGDLRDELIGMLSLMRANPLEAEAVTGISPEDRLSAEEAARVLLAKGAGAVALQLRGSNLYVSAHESFEVQELPVHQVDVTGAGDAAAAALAVAFAEGLSLERAAQMATAASAFSVTVLGAQASFPKRSALRDLLSQELSSGF